MVTGSPWYGRAVAIGIQVSLTADNIMELVATCMVVLQAPLTHSGQQQQQGRPSSRTLPPLPPLPDKPVVLCGSPGGVVVTVEVISALDPWFDFFS